MTIPQNTYYPENIDSEENLYIARDGLRLKLSEDYNPGDSVLYVEGDALIMAKFPSTGIITLTEQCSDIDERAVSLYYGSIDYVNFVFGDLELIPGFANYFKPKKITNVTQNVMDLHHNNLKDSLIAIEEFIGTKGSISNGPGGTTIEERTNFLRSIALRPKAWFSSDKTIGIVPFEVTFQNLSFKLASDGKTDNYSISWDFGDNTTSLISAVELVNLDKITHTYYSPGLYSPTLTVTNPFGTDTCTFEDYINARIEAPEEAVINFEANSPLQIITLGNPIGGPYTTPPKIRTPINTTINISVPDGENPNTPGVAYSGELIGLGDPITSYTWELGDDLLHSNSQNAKATYSIGGFYDLNLRTDTQARSYRITTYKNCIDVVEQTNLWLLNIADDSLPNEISIYEYGLISETFKISNNPTFTIQKNNSFLNNVPQSAMQKKEFRRNVLLTQSGTTPSGSGGNLNCFYSSGRNELDPSSLEEIKSFNFNGLTGTLSSLATGDIYRQWNWVGLSNDVQVNFILGKGTISPNSSPTNSSKVTIELGNLNKTTNSSFLSTSSNLNNGAEELRHNPSQFDENGDSIYGDFSIYRSTWKDGNGYIVRNDNPPNDFLRLKNFYRTEGTVGSPVSSIRKLKDVGGTTKVEGDITALSLGIYFFNNSGSISQYSTSSSSWQTGGPGINSVSYRSLQDTSVSGFDDIYQELFLTSDKDKRAYIAYTYSDNVFLGFNELTLSFRTLGNRPNGQPWVMEIF